MGKACSWASRGGDCVLCVGGQNYVDGRFSFEQIDMVLQTLRAQGKTPCLTLPYR